MTASPADLELQATRVEIDGPVATVWLHRPHRHNAWTGRMHTEYRALLARLERDRAVRAIVVTGTPPASAWPLPCSPTCASVRPPPS